MIHVLKLKNCIKKLLILRSLDGLRAFRGEASEPEAAQKVRIAGRSNRFTQFNAAFGRWFAGFTRLNCVVLANAAAVRVHDLRQKCSRIA